MNNILIKLGFLNDDTKVSLTNVIVYLFVIITAFRAIFSGVVIDLKFFDWKIQELDVSSTLPLLFSLLNYSHKRVMINQNEQKVQEVSENKTSK